MSAPQSGSFLSPGTLKAVTELIATPNNRKDFNPVIEGKLPWLCVWCSSKMITKMYENVKHPVLGCRKNTRRYFKD
jgi:hypothetical protein